jgi:DNA-binding transcriptional ArsR family regulator
MKQAVLLFKALGDPVRLRIVKLLEGGELCVCQLTEAMGLGQSRISRHLAVLKAAGLIDDLRDGKWVHYRIRGRLLQLIGDQLDDLDHEEPMKRDRRAIARAKPLIECRLQKTQKTKRLIPCRKI